MTNSLAIIVAMTVALSFLPTLYLDHKVKSLRVTSANDWTGGEMVMVALASLLTIGLVVMLGMGYAVAIGTIFAATMSYVVGATVTKTVAYAFGFVALISHMTANMRRERRLKALEAALPKASTTSATRTVKIDVDASAAEAKIKALEARATALHANIKTDAVRDEGDRK